MTVSYDEYIVLFGGLAKIPEEAFEIWTLRSALEINRYISVPLETLEDDMAKLCMIEVAESLYSYSQRDGILSENTDGYSVTYDKAKSDIYPIIKRHLAGYLYRGVEL